MTERAVRVFHFLMSRRINGSTQLFLYCHPHGATLARADP